MGTLRTRVQERIGTLIIDNPDRRNALSREMWREFPKHVARLDGDDDVRVLVVTGAGDKAFASGADISEFKAMRGDPAMAAEYSEHTIAAFRSLRDCSKPVIAMIRGFCMGGGWALALNCDLRVASEDARFSIPAAKLGLALEYENVKQIADIAGAAMAREVLLTARVYEARELFDRGLLHQLSSGPGLETFTEKYAGGIAANAPLSLRYSKIALREFSDDARIAPSEETRGALAAAFDSEDYKEGYNAFLEKRKPDFKGR